VLVPKLFTTLKGYRREDFLADLGAGIVVGIVALPLCVAFAIASGVTPERGLYTGIVAGFLISVLGGSRVQIGGPTGAFVVVVAGIVASHGIDGLIVATLLAGVLLVAAGLAQLGDMIRYVPFPVVTGFTGGIALIIFSQQVKDLLGLSVATVPAEFLGRWSAYLAALDTANLATIGVSLGTLAILIGWPKLSTKVPAPFVALLAGTIAVALLELPVATIGSRFGIIDASLPRPTLPVISEAMVVELIGPAFTIAFLGGIESLLSAVVADGMIGSRHRSNVELVAQGVANIASPLVGGIPATGAIARTATNVRNGGRTPIAGIVHALTLLVVTLFAGRWAAHIPLATLAAILTVVAYHMSEWRTFRTELRGPRSDAVVLLTTFGLTVFVDLTVAIAVGMVLASFLFMKRMAEATEVAPIATALRASEEASEAELEARHRRVPRDVEVFDLNGPIFFGAAQRFADALRGIHWRPRAIILDMADVPIIDATGLRVLADMIRECRSRGVQVVAADLTRSAQATIQASTVAALLAPHGLELDFSGAVAALGATDEHPTRSS